jgi:hypothetical protein
MVCLTVTREWYLMCKYRARNRSKEMTIMVVAEIAEKNNPNVLKSFRIVCPLKPVSGTRYKMNNG